MAQAPESTTPPGVWNQWRGPERTGIAPGPVWPETLKEENFEREWRVELQASYSGPVVDAERIYTTATIDKRDEVVRAFDRFTGEELWSQRWEGAMSVPFFAAKNGSWIRSTPTLDEGRLYVAGMCDVLVCLDSEDGSVLWQVDFTERFGTPHEDFGFVCSPLVQGKSVYVQTGAGFIKLDKETGETQWRTLDQSGGDMMKSGAFSSPVFANLLGTNQLLVQGRTALHGVAEDDGEVLWSMDIRSFRGMNILTPVPYGDGVFTSAYGGRAHFFELGQTQDGFSVEEKWTNRAQAYMSSPVVLNGHAYLYLRSKRFGCVDLESGEVAWISEPIGDEYWSLVAQGDRILALSNEGEIRLIAADPEEFRVLDRFELTENNTWAHLAVDGRQVFVRDLNGLSAYAWQ
jgi:outer membrane protein assembly factor BamB